MQWVISVNSPRWRRTNPSAASARGSSSRTSASRCGSSSSSRASARRATGTVYLYVENKEALFRTLARTTLDGVLATARAAAEARGGSIAERLTTVLDAKFGFFHELLHRSPHASELLTSSSRLCADIFA